MSKDTEKEKYVAKTVEQGLAELKKETNSEGKCVDLNQMVFTYGKFHNNFVN